jgi:hypothetical protein
VWAAGFTDACSGQRCTCDDHLIVILLGSKAMLYKRRPFLPELSTCTYCGFVTVYFALFISLELVTFLRI